MVKINFWLVTLLLVLPAMWSSSLTMSSVQPESSHETVAPSVGISKQTMLHTEVDNGNATKTVTATTATGGLKTRTPFFHLLYPAASPTKSKGLTEVFNNGFKHSTGIVTSSSVSPEDQSPKNDITIKKGSQSPSLPSSSKITPLQGVSETSAELSRKTAELTVAETTNGTKQLDKITIKPTTITVGLNQAKTESSPMASSTFTAASSTFTAASTSSNHSSSQSMFISKTTHGRPATTNFMHPKSTKGPLVLSKSTISTPPNFITQSTTMSTSRKPTQATIKLESTSPAQQRNNYQGVIVAIVIGTVLILMIVVILLFLFKKRLSQDRKDEDQAWAGPTPFLDGEIQPRLIGVEDDSIAHKSSSKRVSLQSFLPRRSDKHQSLLMEGNDQVAMEELQEGTTFGRVQKSNPALSNGTAPIDGATDKPEPPPQCTSSTDGNVNLAQDIVEEEAISPAPPVDSLSAPTAPLQDVDLGPPIGEEVPPTLNEAPSVAPPPPLPSSEK